MAPFMPFLAEAIFSNLKMDGDLVSVHLNTWPKAEKTEDEILVQMKQVRELIELGLNQREQAKIKVRQPLSEFTVQGKGLPKEMAEIIQDELNVKKVSVGKENRIDTNITPELKLEGIAREIVRAVQVLRKENGLEITDRINLSWDSGDEEVVQAMERFGEYIKTEVLADSLERGSGEKHTVNEFVVELRVEKK